MLKNVEWGEYKLEQLFDIVGTKSLDSNAIEFKEKGVNFVGRTFIDNGIQGKIQKREFEPNEPFTITATVIGNYKYVKYQKEPYYCSQNINKLTPKPIISKWNDRIAYYFVTNIQKFVSLYDNQQGGYKLNDIKQHKIQIPMLDGKIDFNFMERFIAKLEAQRVAELENQRDAKLEAYLISTGLKDYTLTDSEKKVLNDYNNLEFAEFNVTDIFDVNNTNNILFRDIKPNSGNIPYLCASSENNGVSSCITYNKKYIDKGNCIFIGGKTFVVSYQKNDFYSNDSHNLVLYLINEERTKLKQLYLVTCIKKSLSHKYSWGDSISKTKIKKDKISLPISNGKINFGIMETFISAIQKLVIKDVVEYTDKKIEETEKVIKK